MSAAAEELVRECAHPKVRGSRRALLIAIAKLIPEGQTKTAPISIEELMASSGYYDQSVRKARDVLVAIGALRVVGGGRGRAASYELLALPGAGADPSLPLIGVVRSGRRAARCEPPPLFDQVDVQVDATTSPTDAIEDPAKKVGTKYRTWRTNIGEKYRTLRGAWRAIVTKVGTFHRSLVTIVSNVGTLYRTRRSNIGEKYRTVLKKVGTFHRTSTAAVDVDVRARARSEEEVEEVVDARAREVTAFLDWFDAEYAAHHHGARCTIAPEDASRVRALLRGGRTVERLKALADVMWAITSDGVASSDRWYVAERVPVRNVWLLHRKADFLDVELSRRTNPQGDHDPVRHRRGEVVGEDVWSEILRRIETKVNRHSFCKWWVDSVLVGQRPGAIDVAMKTPEHAAWVQKHYKGVLEEAIAEVRPGLSVQFVDPPAAAAPRWARSS